MSNVVNLNKYRKRKARAEREKRADTNRRLHGRTKAERAREDLQKKQLFRVLDGAHLERTDSDTPTPRAEKEPPQAQGEPPEDAG